MNIQSINFFKQSKYYLYFVTFKSYYFTINIFKIGITTDLDKRLKSLKNEYKIQSDFKLLLALQVNSPEIEKDMLTAFNNTFPELRANIKINKVQKIECMKYHDDLIDAIEQVQLLYTQQLNLHYFKNISIKCKVNKLSHADWNVD